MLRRYAHWEWDKDQEKQEAPPQYKFTAKQEFEYRRKMEAKGAEKTMRQKIIKKWVQHLPDVQGLNTFGKHFTMQTTLHSPMGTTKASRMGRTATSLSPHRCSESLMAVGEMIQELDDMKRDN